MHKKFYLITKVLVILILPIWIMVSSVRLLVTSEYMRIEYYTAGFPVDTFGFDQEQRINIASENVSYLRENLPISALANQKIEGQALYNARELKHMEDVQGVYQFFWTIWKVI